MHGDFYLSLLNKGTLQRYQYLYFLIITFFLFFKAHQANVNLNGYKAIQGKIHFTTKNRSNLKYTSLRKPFCYPIGTVNPTRQGNEEKLIVLSKPTRIHFLSKIEELELDGEEKEELKFFLRNENYPSLKGDKSLQNQQEGIKSIKKEEEIKMIGQNNDTNMFTDTTRLNKHLIFKEKSNKEANEESEEQKERNISIFLQLFKEQMGMIRVSRSLREEANMFLRNGDLHAAIQMYKDAEEMLTVDSSKSGIADEHKENRHFFLPNGAVVKAKNACRLNRALCYMKLGEYESAIRACDLILKTDIDIHEAESNVDVSKESNEDKKNIFTENNEANSIIIPTPVKVKALYRRGISFQKLGNTQKAALDLNYANELEPEDPHVRKALLNLGLEPIILTTTEKNANIEASPMIYEGTARKDGINKNSLTIGTDDFSPHKNAMNPMNIMSLGQTGNFNSFGDVGGLSALAGLSNMSGDFGSAVSGSGVEKFKALGKLVLTYLEKEETLSMIVNFGKSTSVQSLESMSKMAGLSLSESTIKMVHEFVSNLSVEKLQSWMRSGKKCYKIYEVSSRGYKAIGPFVRPLYAFSYYYLLFSWIKSIVTL